MCCITGSRVVHVSWTRIFARALDELHQGLVYAMELSADTSVAMVLPLPVPAGSADDAVRFVDLSVYSTFFADLQRLWPPPAMPPQAFGAARDPPHAAPLVVHQVGDFEASFVPSPRDFTRLDRRFQLPSKLFEVIPHYRDWGFAVFQLRGLGGGAVGVIERARRALGLAAPAPNRATEFHPMALVFPRRDPSTLFFPTVHVHDGDVHPLADFHHQLYLQLDGDLGGDLQGWSASALPAKAAVDRSRAQGLVDGERPVHVRGLHGSRKNEDVVVQVAPRPTGDRRVA